MEEVWDATGYPEGDGLVIEAAAIGIPDGSGGMDMYWYGDHIPASIGQCNITFPTAASAFGALPEPGTWPSGAVIFHAHPYLPAAGTQTCGVNYNGAASDGDLDHLDWVENHFEADVTMVVMDPTHVYAYESEQTTDDAAKSRRCGY